MEKKVVCSMWLLCLVVGMVVAPASGLSCGNAVSALIPCGPFLVSSGGPGPSTACCTSAQSLNQMAATKANRQALCVCLKESGPSFGVKPEKAKQLPQLCKLKLNIPVSRDVDCDQD